MPFFVIFIIIPFLEIMTFMVVGEYIGLGTTLFLAFLTAIIGGAIVKHQGLKTILAIRTSLDQGKLPGGAFFDGLCLVAAGATLITPGFLTDTIGFLLLVPAVRSALLAVLKKHTTWVADISKTGQDGVLEGEFETLDEEKKKL